MTSGRPKEQPKAASQLDEALRPLPAGLAAAIFEQAPTALLLFSADDPDFTAIAANQAFLTVSGSNREELAGHALAHCFPANARQLQASMQQALRTRRADDLTPIKGLLPGHAQRSWHVKHTPVVMDDGATFILQSLQPSNPEREHDAFLLRLDELLRPLTETVDVLTAATRLVCEYLEADSVAYIQLAGQEKLEIVYRYVRPGAPAAAESRPQAKWTADGEAGLRRGSVYVNSHETDAVMCTPLLQAGRLTAVMEVQQQAARVWLDDEVNLLSTAANRIFDLLERAQAARALLDSEQRSRLAQRAGKTGAFEWVIKEGRVIWTPELEFLYGLQEATFEGTLIDWRRRVHPEDAAMTEAGMLRCLQQKNQEYVHEFRALLPDGTQRWLRGQARVFYDAAGEPERMIGVNIDIDAQKQAEADLRQQWHTFDTALSNSPDLTYTFDLKGRFTYVNRQVLMLSGRTLEQTLGRTPVELGYPNELAKKIESQLSQVRLTRQHVRDQTSFTLPSGAVREYEYIYVPVLAENGEVEAITGSTRDITEHKQAEERVRESETRFRQLFDAVPQLVWSANADGSVDLYNRQWVDYTGLSLEESQGDGWIPVIHPDDLARTEKRWRRAVETGEPYQIEYRFRRHDGQFRWFLGRGNPVRDAHGNIVKWIGTCTDIDDWKESETALRKANRELEEFSYVASHDLQEPLRMVNIYTQLILKSAGELDSDLNEYAGYVRQGVRRMEALIHDLLLYSRVSHAELRVSGLADLSAAFAEAVSVCKEEIQESGAAITTGPLPAVCGDTQQMAHVFQNLLSNALKYRQADGKPEIRISSRREASNWVIAVRDNGIGFEQQYAERIFGLFKRLHNHEYPGTGLGLAICQRIVERYEGRMWAEGRPGDGATFYFSLPGAEPGC